MNGILDKITKNLTDNGESTFINKSVESQLVGSLIKEPQGIFDLYDEYPKFSPDIFQDQNCKKVFETIYNLTEDEKEVNIASVSYYSQIGEPDLRAYIDTSIECDSVTSLGEILFDKYLRRQSFEFFQKGMDSILDPNTNVFEFVEQVNGNLNDVLDSGENKSEGSAASIMHDTMTEIVKRAEMAKAGKMHLSGIPTGLTEVNNFTGGYQDGQLIIVAARPGMGKSALIAKNLLEAAKAGNPVGLFTLEMTNNEVFTRMLAIEAKVNTQKFKNGTFDPEDYAKIDECAQQIKELPIYSDDRSGITLSYLRRVASKWKRKHGIKALFIDYIGLMSGSGKRGQNRTQEVGEISRGLKTLAKNLNIPVVVLSQLNRAVETRGGLKKPVLSDLRESGDIEQDADIVMFVWRGPYYGILFDADNEPLEGTAEIIFAKHRNGSLGTIDVGFTDYCVDFHDLQKDRVFNGLTSRTLKQDNGASMPNGQLVTEPEQTPKTDWGANRPKDTDPIPF